MFYVDSTYTSAYLCHHGIKGMKWGIRRYQNSDGSLTDEGKKRYSKLERKQNRFANSVKSKTESLYKTSKSAHDPVVNRKVKRYVTSKANRVMNSKQKQRLAKAKESASNAIKEYNRHLKEATKAADTALEKNPNMSRKAYDAYIGNYMKQYRNAGKKMEQAQDDYRKECQTVTKELLGAYGNMTISKSNSSSNRYTVEKLVSTNLQDSTIGFE